MKILLVNKFYYHSGGAERHYFDLLKLLTAKGHLVIPFAMADDKNIATPYEKYFVSKIEASRVTFGLSGLKIVLRFFYSWEARRKMRKLINEQKPDLAHLHNIYHQISPSILSLFKQYDIPVVMSVHDHKLIAPNYYLKNGKGETCGQDHPFWRCIFKKCVKNSFWASLVCVLEFYFHAHAGFYKKYIDYYLVPSAYLAQKLIAAGYPKNKIKILAHFIEPLNVVLPPFKKSGEKEVCLAFIGRLSPEKGLDVLLSALAKTNKSIKLKIIGAGDVEKYRLLATNLQLTSRVEFVPYPNNGKISADLRDCLAVVVPSKVPETFGLAVLEAYRLGKAVIASCEGALSEVVREGETGYLFPINNEQKLVAWLDRTADCQEEFLRFGERGRELVARNYNPQDYYQRLIRIYQEAQKICNF